MSSSICWWSATSTTKNWNKNNNNSIKPSKPKITISKALGEAWKCYADNSKKSLSKDKKTKTNSKISGQSILRSVIGPDRVDSTKTPSPISTITARVSELKRTHTSPSNPPSRQSCAMPPPGLVPGWLPLEGSRNQGDRLARKYHPFDRHLHRECLHDYNWSTMNDDLII